MKHHPGARKWLVIGGLLSMAVVGCGGPQPTGTATPTPFFTATSTLTATLEPTATCSATPTLTATSTAISPPTGTPSPEPTTLTPTSTASPTTLPANAQVATGGIGLRLRADPGQDGDILSVVEDGTLLQVVGRTGDNTWLRVVTPDNQVGWMMTSYVDLNISLDTLAVLDYGSHVILEAAPPRTGAQVAANRGGMRLRAEPNDQARVLADLPALAPLVILSRTEDGLWLRVATESDGVGWVWAEYVEVYVDLRLVPVGGGDDVAATLAARALITPTVPATAVAVLPPFAPNAQVAAGRGGLRVRLSPGTAGQESVRLNELTELQVIGRTADQAWLQVITPERNMGWVWAGYVDVSVDLNAVPVSGTAVNTPEQVAEAPPDQSAPPAAEVSPPLPAVPARAPLPVITGITSHTREIFRRGQSLGNRANVFSKVGDSITAVDYFLNPIGWELCDLGSYEELAPVLNYFMAATARDSNSFTNQSLAAYPWWTTASVLTPGLSPGGIGAGICQPGEVPLVCEYRVVRPAVALIMLGTNDIHLLSFEDFQRNLTRIVEISIDMGVIPVLSTIPDQLNARGDAVALYNQTIVNTARAYDVPLWDYWGAMRSLPNYGLSSDGVHPSLPPGETRSAAVFTPENLGYGYTVRNLTALQVLDAVWRQAMN